MHVRKLQIGVEQQAQDMLEQHCCHKMRLENQATWMCLLLLYSLGRVRWCEAQCHQRMQCLTPHCDIALKADLPLAEGLPHV